MYILYNVHTCRNNKKRFQRCTADLFFVTHAYTYMNTRLYKAGTIKFCRVLSNHWSFGKLSVFRFQIASYMIWLIEVIHQMDSNVRISSQRNQPGAAGESTLAFIWFDVKVEPFSRFFLDHITTSLPRDSNLNTIETVADPSITIYTFYQTHCYITWQHVRADIIIIKINSSELYSPPCWLLNAHPCRSRNNVVVAFTPQLVIRDEYESMCTFTSSFSCYSPLPQWLVVDRSRRWTTLFHCFCVHARTHWTIRFVSPRVLTSHPTHACVFFYFFPIWYYFIIWSPPAESRNRLRTTTWN